MTSAEMQSKTDIRRNSIALRHTIADEEKKRSESRIAENIRNLIIYKKAKTVALYYPVRGEADLLILMNDPDKIFVFPKVQGEDLVFYPARSRDDFVKGRFGIPEPCSDEAVPVHDIDVIVVPGVCFDMNNKRLGYGRGYYDRLIQASPETFTLGVCFDKCCMERLPVDSWDMSVNCVVTQTSILKIKM